MALIYCILLVSVPTVTGFMFDDPCHVFPRYSGGIPDDPDFTTDVSVPASCRNGTFRWDYPKGHAIVTFHNIHRASTSICFRDRLGGDVFVITDMTGTTNKLVGSFDYNHWACTTATPQQDIVFKVDAPEDLRYMGEFEYKLQ